MSTNDDKYLVLRGKNKDIYFIQKRISSDISSIIGKNFIKKSLETKNIHIARQKRDEILEELEKISLNHTLKLENATDLDNSDNMISVPIEKEPQIDYEIDNSEDQIISKKKKYSIFPLKFPTREDLILYIDKYIPISIVILTLFVAFVV